MGIGRYQARISTRAGSVIRLAKFWARLLRSLSSLDVSRRSTPIKVRSLPEELRNRATAWRYAEIRSGFRQRSRSHFRRLCCTPMFLALFSSCQLIPLRLFITCGGTRVSAEVLISPNNKAWPRVSRQKPTKSAPGRLAWGVRRSRCSFQGQTMSRLASCSRTVSARASPISQAFSSGTAVKKRSRNSVATSVVASALSSSSNGSLTSTSFSRSATGPAKKEWNAARSDTL